MFHFFGFLFVIIVAVLVIGLSIIGSVLRTIFGGGEKHRPSSGSQHSGRGYSYSGNRQQTSSARPEGDTPREEDAPRKHRKLFSKDEGEYVDFEEIKE